MKSTCTFLALLLAWAINGKAQSNMNFLVNFEDSAAIDQYYYTDSLLDSAGIWQIGTPRKVIFNSAFSGTHATTTLTDSLVPGGIKASFIITLPGVYLDVQTGGYLTFRHKYDLDSAYGVAYAEFSVDSGVHWHSVRPADERHDCDFYTTFLDGQQFYPPTWWDNLPRHMNSDSNYCLSGRRSNWVSDTIGFAPSWYAVKTDQWTSFMLRFTIQTDSAAAPSEGWLIDDIGFSYYSIFCGGAIKELNSSHLHISPNPASGAFQIALTDQAPGDYTVTLTDLMGREMMQQHFTGAEVMVRSSGLAPGSYMVRVVNEKTGDSFSKRVVID